MKKFLIMALCVATSAGAFAQEQALKDVEKDLKLEAPHRANNRNLLTRAMADPATKDDVRTWFLAGKNEFGVWDDIYQQMSLGGNGDVRDMSRSIINGYRYLFHALPLDTVVDEKGKVKTKYSKQIVQMLADNYRNADNAARFLYEAGDYAGCYDAWLIYAELPSNPVLGKLAPAALPDSVNAELWFNMGVASWQGDLLEQALDAFQRSIQYGNTSQNVFDYAISCATQAGRTDDVLALAEQAFPIYGGQDSKYIMMMINGSIDKGDTTGALSKLDTAIANEPDNALLYDAKGILIESQRTDDTPVDQATAIDAEAFEYYKKAVELDPNYARAQYDLGRKYADQAYRINDTLTDVSNEEYTRIKEETILPLFRNAVLHLEKAYELDPEGQRNALKPLRNVYYNLQDAENMERIENLL